MPFFSPVENSHALIRKNGVFSEAPLVQYQGILYAKIGTGHIRLKREQLTSQKNTYWDEIDLDPVAGSLVQGIFNMELKAPSPTRKKRTYPRQAAE